MSRPEVRLYLGTHRPRWLWTTPGVSLFVSHRVLSDRRTRFPEAVTSWALDSGAYTELDTFGRWEETPRRYAAAVRRYAEELGGLEWASPQDWLCAPKIRATTGLTVAEHQARTLASVLELRELAPEVRWVPVLQGWEPDDFHAHVAAYAAAGLDLAQEPLVGVGSIAARQGRPEVGRLLLELQAQGLRLHGYGVKLTGFRLYADALTSADSLSWSQWARRDAAKGIRRDCGKSTCANCQHYALEWRDYALGQLDARPATLF